MMLNISSLEESGSGYYWFS